MTYYLAISRDKINGANLVSQISTHCFYKFSQTDNSLTLEPIKSFFLRKRQYLQNTTNAFIAYSYIPLASIHNQCTKGNSLSSFRISFHRTGGTTYHTVPTPCKLYGCHRSSSQHKLD
jgi:hypothetical protein